MSIVWIGYDSREPQTYEACRNSIIRNSPTIQPMPLVRNHLQQMQLYWRADPKAATDFSLTRFLVPALNHYHSWALFCDCDFIFTRPLEELFALADPAKAVMVVKHGPELWRKAHGNDDVVVKMDGKVHSYYPCKWWSALTLWNCDHPANFNMTPRWVNEATPSTLHRFGWLKEEQIGELPADWHWLDGYSAYPESPGSMVPSGIHFTRGSPELFGWEQTRYAELWRANLRSR